MKVRLGFVTNSSSSSFIIGKKDEEHVTIESVYQKIKSYYLEYLEKIRAVISYIEKHPETNLVYKIEGEYLTFKSTKGSIWDNPHRKTIKKDFGIDVWNYFKLNNTWTLCETYKDYEDYWIYKMENDNTDRIYAPFTIRSFVSDDMVKWLHHGKLSADFRDEDECCGIDIKSWILGWYYPYLEDIMKYNCDTCPNSEWCDKEECNDTRTMIKGVEFPEDKACLYLLGRVCIESECGYIPDYVVEKIKKDAEYACNHMG